MKVVVFTVLIAFVGGCTPEPKLNAPKNDKKSPPIAHEELSQPFARVNEALLKLTDSKVVVEAIPNVILGDKWFVDYIHQQKTKHKTFLEDYKQTEESTSLGDKEKETQLFNLYSKYVALDTWETYDQIVVGFDPDHEINSGDLWAHAISESNSDTPTQPHSGFADGDLGVLKDVLAASRDSYMMRLVDDFKNNSEETLAAIKNLAERYDNIDCLLGAKKVGPSAYMVDDCPLFDPKKISEVKDFKDLDASVLVPGKLLLSTFQFSYQAGRMFTNTKAGSAVVDWVSRNMIEKGMGSLGKKRESALNDALAASVEVSKKIAEGVKKETIAISQSIEQAVSELVTREFGISSDTLEAIGATAEAGISAISSARELLKRPKKIVDWIANGATYVTGVKSFVENTIDLADQAIKADLPGTLRSRMLAGLSGAWGFLSGKRGSNEGKQIKLGGGDEEQDPEEEQVDPKFRDIVNLPMLLDQSEAYFYAHINHSGSSEDGSFTLAVPLNCPDFSLNRPGAFDEYGYYYVRDLCQEEGQKLVTLEYCDNNHPGGCAGYGMDFKEDEIRLIEIGVYSGSEQRFSVQSAITTALQRPGTDAPVIGVHSDQILVQPIEDENAGNTAPKIRLKGSFSTGAEVPTSP